MAKRNTKTQGPDYLLLVIVGTLLIIGLTMVYSASFNLGYTEYDQRTYFLVRQVIWMLLGAAVTIVMARTEYHTWQRFSVLIMAGALGLLTVVLVFGSKKFGGQRWLLSGGSVQPSEFCKLAVIIYIADWLSSKGDRIRQVTYGLIPFAILIGLVAGLIMLQPDFSTSILVALTAAAMFFIAGAEIYQLIISAIFGGATIAVLVAQAPYRLERIVTFLGDPMADPYDRGYQIRQTLIALGSGGLAGVGLGAGKQKFGYLPAAHTDAIFAVLGEELGLIGCLVVVGLFAALAYRGFRIALNAPDAFGTVLATGLTFLLIFQALVNIAVVTATLPVTGMPLPFISFGGSSLVVSMAGVGLLFSISRRTQKAVLRTRASYALRRGDGRPRVSPARRRRNVKKR